MRFYIIMLTGLPWVLVPQQLRRSDRYRPWRLPYHLTARTKHQVPHHCTPPLHGHPPAPLRFGTQTRHPRNLGKLHNSPTSWAWGTETFPFQSQQPTSPPSTPDGLDSYLTQSPIPQPTRNSSICRLLNRKGAFLHPVI